MAYPYVHCADLYIFFSIGVTEYHERKQVYNLNYNLKLFCAFIDNLGHNSGHNSGVGAPDSYYERRGKLKKVNYFANSPLSGHKFPNEWAYLAWKMEREKGIIYASQTI